MIKKNIVTKSSKTLTMAALGIQTVYVLFSLIFLDVLFLVYPKHLLFCNGKEELKSRGRKVSHMLAF